MHVQFFSEQLAIDYGIKESIALQQIANQIKENKENRHKVTLNGKEVERTWITHSIKEWHSNFFHYWTISRVRNVFNSLRKKGILMMGYFNSGLANRIPSYALVDEERILYIIDHPNANEEEEAV